MGGARDWHWLFLLLFDSKEMLVETGRGPGSCGGVESVELEVRVCRIQKDATCQVLFQYLEGQSILNIYSNTCRAG